MTTVAPGILATLTLVASGCGDDQDLVQPSQPPKTAAPQPEPKVEQPAPEPQPDPVEVALREGRFEVVCEALVRQGFSEPVCAFLMARADGERASLNERQLRQFFQSQKVRRLQGRIIDVYERGEHSVTYEIRTGGGTALLETTDTQFTTTGGFSIWAQRTPNDEEVVFNSGRARGIPVYVEWKLADDILDVARSRSGDGQELARGVLEDLISGWELQWRHEDTEPPEEQEAQESPPAQPERETATAPETESASRRRPRRRERQGVSADAFE